jgi:hypothetical protein
MPVAPPTKHMVYAQPFANAQVVKSAQGCQYEENQLWDQSQRSPRSSPYQLFFSAGHNILDHSPPLKLI